MKDYNKKVGEDYIDRIILYIQKNRMQTFYNIVLLIIILIQTPFMIAGLDSVTVEVDLPPKGKIIVKNDSANALYYKMWAEHYTNDNEYYYVNKDGNKQLYPYTASLVTFDYTNVEEKYDNFLKRYKPSKLLKDKRVYQSFIKNIKVKMISQKFDVEQITPRLYYDGRKAEVTISGVAHQFAASTKIGDKQCKYTMTFERIGGKIYATSLNTNCF
ncbi:TraE/TraK family type IV conjugative transfer system protein [Sulfurimonas sp.]